jgi:hypothetical protein
MNDDETLGPLLPPGDQTTDELVKALRYLLIAFACFVTSLIIFIHVV